MKIKQIAAVLAAAALVLTGCAQDDRQKNDSGRLSVVTTNFAMYDFARAAAGDHCDVTMLLPPGAESHDFEASLTDIAKISEADVFVCVGSEDWVDDAFDAMGSLGDDIVVVDAMETVLHHGTDFVSGEVCTVGGDHDHEHDHDHDALNGMDEHVWMSVGNAKAVMDEIAEQLISLDPALAESVEANITAYFSRLDAVDEAFYALAESSDKKLIVADRFPFAYFTARYGFEYEAAFSGCSSETEPTLAMIAALAEAVRSEEVGAVFTIEFSDGKTARAISAETGCDILTLQSAQNVTKAEFEAGITFADIMEQNLEAMKTAFGEE